MSKAAGKKRLFILVLAAVLVFLTAGCGVSALMDMMKPGAPDRVQTPEPPAAQEQPADTEQPANSERPVQKSEPDAAPKPPKKPVAEPPLKGFAAGTPQEIYKPIIDAYIEAHEDGFASVDPIIEDTFLATNSHSADMTGIGMELSEVSLYYANWDMNGDRIPELFIIGSDSYASYIWGAYTIAGNTPRSLLQQTSAREEISLHINEDGESALVHEWSHMGEVTTLFYTLPAGADRLALEAGLYTDWNEAAQKEEYSDLENSEIVKYGDHYKGASSLYADAGGLTPISMSEWEAVWARYSARVMDFPDIRSLSDYPAGF